MTDSTLNRFISAGSAAARAAFTPSPPTPAAGAAQGYFWHETDTGDTYSWKAGTGWIKVNTGSLTTASTTEQLTGTDSAKAATSDSVAALWEQGADVASAGTTSLGEGGYFNITGTTTITDIDFATDKAGRKAWVKFMGILTLTHNASTLILPTAANITTAAGDTACFISEGSDVVRCVAYTRASGAALTASSSSAVTLVQYKSFVGNTPTLTLDAAPTAGNQLILMGTNWNAITAVASPWVTVLRNDGVSNDGDVALIKLVTNGDHASATITNPITVTASQGKNITIAEVSGALGISSISFDAYKEFTGASKTLDIVSGKAGSLVLGFASSNTTNVAPSSITNATALTTVQGTSTGGSPRQITPFKIENVAVGGVTITITYASGSTIQAAFAYVFTPG